MAKNRSSAQSLFQEEFGIPKTQEKIVERPAEERKPAVSEEPKQKETTDATAPVVETVASTAPAPAKKSKAQGDFRSSSIYLSGENVNFVKYITRQRKVSQKKYLLDLLTEKRQEIEEKNPLTETKILDFKQPVQAKYRSNKANSTIYSISAPVELLDYFDRVCERDHISFSTLVDDTISVKREEFLAGQ